MKRLVRSTYLRSLKIMVLHGNEATGDYPILKSSRLAHEVSVSKVVLSDLTLVSTSVSATTPLMSLIVTYMRIILVIRYQGLFGQFVYPLIPADYYEDLEGFL